MREVRWSLTFLFIGMLLFKLAGVIRFSWWWVTSPVWIPAALAVVFYALLGAITLRSYRKSKGKK